MPIGSVTRSAGTLSSVFVMGKLLTHMTMSLDGYIAQPDDSNAELFDWYGAGDVAVQTSAGATFNVDAASAEVLRELTERCGAIISGRRLFDLAHGWDDNHPGGAPVVVVTHSPPADAERFPRTTFVDGVEPAVAKAQEIAGDKNVTIASPDIIRQALDLGLVDELWVSVVPVLFGEGIPYFAKLEQGHLLLEDSVAPCT
jgi:dihydrofolate reductase